MYGTIRDGAAMVLGLFAAFASTSNCLGDDRSADGQCRVLIITGEDTHHDWRSTTPVLYELLHQDPRIRVDVLSDLAALEVVKLEEYASVVIHFKNATPGVPGRRAFENLRSYVRGGGGLVLVHFACGAFEEFKDEYVEMVGRVWFGERPPPGCRQHDPRGPFTIEITGPEHAVTKGLSRITTDDELYTCLEGEAAVTVVATAKSKIDGKPYPMAMLHQYGEGRVFNCTLGHDVRALRAELIGKLYRRGCAWSAGLPPASEE